MDFLDAVIGPEWIPEDGGSYPGSEHAAEQIAEDEKGAYKRSLVTQELLKREVRRLADAEESKGARSPVCRRLQEEMDLPDDEEEYSIDKLLPTGGNALFAARYKSGKTVFAKELIKSYVDGVPFLGEYQCNPDPERPCVTIFNYEMSEAQFRRWFRKSGIVNKHLVHIVHLRGCSLPLALESVREEIAGWLRESRTGLWIVDPASRAMAGLGDGNDNTDVNAFTGYLDEIKARSGTRDLVLTVHMGHAASQDKDAERALGAQAWSAWADSLWVLTRDKDNIRYFRAYGRDVDEQEQSVIYDPATMSVAVAGKNRYQQQQDSLWTAVHKAMEQNPGVNARGVRDLVSAHVEVRGVDIDRTRDQMVEDGIAQRVPGKGNEVRFFLTVDAPPLYVVPGE